MDLCYIGPDGQMCRTCPSTMCSTVARTYSPMLAHGCGQDIQWIIHPVQIVVEPNLRWTSWLDRTHHADALGQFARTVLPSTLVLGQVCG